MVHVLNSPQYLLKIDSQSTGSTKTSRNRFKEPEFLQLEVAMPTDDGELEAIVEMLDLADDLRGQQERLLESVKAVRDGVSRLLPGPDAS